MKELNTISTVVDTAVEKRNSVVQPVFGITEENSEDLASKIIALFGREIEEKPSFEAA